MQYIVSPRQHQILNLLLKNKNGLSIEEIATELNISRTAVQQHFNKLERDGYLEMRSLNKTAGRPVRTFVLTEAGINCFPKRYSWFSELLLGSLKQEMGQEAFQRYMHKLGKSLAESLLQPFEGMPTERRLIQLLKTMSELGFQVTLIEDETTGRKTIKAFNCVYHDLAQKFQEVCEFDLALISTLLNEDIKHPDCMAKGCSFCSFRIGKEID